MYNPTTRRSHSERQEHAISSWTVENISMFLVAKQEANITRMEQQRADVQQVISVLESNPTMQDRTLSSVNKRLLGKLGEGWRTSVGYSSSSITSPRGTVVDIYKHVLNIESLKNSHEHILVNSYKDIEAARSFIANVGQYARAIHELGESMARIDHLVHDTPAQFDAFYLVDTYFDSLPNTAG